MKNYPVIPWMGSKRRLAKHILPLFQAQELALNESRHKGFV